MTAKIQLGHLETQMNTPTVWLTEPQRQELISRMMVLHEKVKKASQMWNENRLEAGKILVAPRDAAPYGEWEPQLKEICKAIGISRSTAHN